MKKTKKIFIIFETNFKFLAILPALNINLGSKEIEIEWLVFGCYLSIETK